MGAPPLLISTTTFTKVARSATALTNLTNSTFFGNTTSFSEPSRTSREAEERY